jgi:hypothetical protein
VNPFDAAMGRALTMWSQAPSDRTAQQTVLGTSWSWGGWFVKNRVRPTAAEKGLINAVQQWALKPNNGPNRQLLLGASWKWGAEKQGAMRGMGEYFAPAAGMGEYFSGVGEYFSGIGAEAAVAPEVATMNARSSMLIGIGGGVAAGFILGYLFHK